MELWCQKGYFSRVTEYGSLHETPTLIILISEGGLIVCVRN